MSRAIVHLDGDAFFAAVEQAADSRLRGKPIVVGGERRGVVASASYEARRYGIRAAMPTMQARKLCPGLIVVSGNFERYEQFSRLMFAYAEDHTPLVEVQGLDEGYYDLTPNRDRPAADIAAVVQRAIRQSLKITVSEGVATNKLVSQIASKANKPAGFRVIPPGEEVSFLHPLPTRWLPGVGPKLAERLMTAGLAEIRQVATMPAELLEMVAGGQARQLLLFSRGIDDRPVVPERTPQKTYSAQQTFPADLTDETYAQAVLRQMADELFAKVREDRRAVRTLAVTVKYNDHDQSQASESLHEPSNLSVDVYGRLGSLLKRAWQRRVSLRLVGLRLSNLYDDRFSIELDLPGQGASRQRKERLASVVDALRHRFGDEILLRGHDFVLRDGPVDATQAPSAKKPARPPFQVGVGRSRRETYVPLACHSHYTFLDSTLSPRRIVELAKAEEMPAVAMTDRGNLHGAGEFALAARAIGVRPIFGAELSTVDGPLFLFVRNRVGYANLCRLLSRPTAVGGSGNPGRAGGEACEGWEIGDGDSGLDDEATVAARHRQSFSRALIREFSGDLIAVGNHDGWATIFGDRFYRAVTRPELMDHPRGVLIPRVHFATSAERRLFNILQSVRTRTLVQQGHPEKRDEDLSFRRPCDLPEWCHRSPAVLRRTREIAEACTFEFPFGPPQFPAYRPTDGSTAPSFLRRLVHEGLRRRYGSGAAGLMGQVEEELKIIADVGYEALFLHTWSLLQDCREAGIEWITRGSAADSLVCYCLGISNVCPIRFELYFKRFLNPERMALNKLPDIDIDFPHDRKDDVVNQLFARFGEQHCAVVGGFSTYQARSAFGDCGKVLGLAEAQIRRFTDRFPWSGGRDLRATLAAGIETRDLPLDEEPYRTALELAALLEGRPRNPKMHPCGVVLSRQPMHELTPTFVSNKGWRTTHYDMDVTESMGLVKMDILAQGGLAVLRDAQKSIERNHGIRVDLGGLAPWKDTGVWELVASGNARAVHHIESPAMLGLSRMSNVREIDGLVAIVSVIRPGAANENKKLAFTRRYQGMEPPSYPHPSLEPCLRSTFGLVVYEEHILQIAEAYAGLSAGRADMLRRGLVKEKQELVAAIQPEFFAAAAARGHPIEKTREVWDLVTSFNGYAFNKAHSTAYGVEAYEAAWVKRYYPAEFLAGVLTHGKGFYSTLVYILECHRLGLCILPPSIQEPGPGYVSAPDGIRVPIAAIQHVGERTQAQVLVERAKGPFTSLEDFARRVQPSAEDLEVMTRVGALDVLGLSRLELFWESRRLESVRARGLEPGQAWLLPSPSLTGLPVKELREPTRQERLQAEWDLLGFTVSGHPLELFGDVHWSSYCPLRDAGKYLGQEITVCGLVVEQRIHHQITGEPMKFLTIADRTEIASTDLFADTYRSYGLATVRYPVLQVTAKVEPFENGKGWSLRALRAGRPRTTGVAPVARP
ncbi:MAG: DNA polymerase IV [Verrucomicrobiales bacterium]|nr:DNA polymerase IV [Verrucomicrobiales bacterium]